MDRIFCMSDIHGFYWEFYRRLDQLGNLHTVLDEGAEDKLILLGDYMDGGPDSRRVLELIHSLQLVRPENFIVLRGNHEEMFLKWLDTYAGTHTGEPDRYGLIPWNDWLGVAPDLQTLRTFLTKPQWDSLRQAMSTMADTPAIIDAACMIRDENRELISWLRGLPCFYETDRQIFVHAGVDEEAGADWKWGISESILLNQYPARTGRFYKDVIAGHIATSTISGQRDFHDIFWDGNSHYYCDGDVAVSRSIPVLVYDESDGNYYSLGDDLTCERRNRNNRLQIRGELRRIGRY